MITETIKLRPVSADQSSVNSTFIKESQIKLNHRYTVTPPSI